MKWLDDQKALYATLGPARFIAIYAALLIYVIGFASLLTWLSDATGWPEAYGSRCHGRGCWPTYLWHSFELLKTHTFYELGLFALLWHLPISAGLFVGFVLTKRSLKRRKNRIRPMRD